MDRSDYLSAADEFWYRGEVLGEASFLLCVAHDLTVITNFAKRELAGDLGIRSPMSLRSCNDRCLRSRSRHSPAANQ